MTPGFLASISRAPLTEDVLAHLPVSGITEYRRGQMIYGLPQSAKRLYLVAAGKVALSRVTPEGGEVLLDIVRPEELFGESALGGGGGSEQAVAHEDTRLMTWALSDIEELVTRRPRLAVALLQILAQRNAELGRRVESFAMDTIERRLARSLVRFAERLGTAAEDGSVRMLPLTHGLLSRYVGTSREIISHYMNEFRRQGYLNYSRREIQLYGDALQAALAGRGLHASTSGI